MIKVFISHQKDDSLLAGRIASRLKINHSIDYYLDVIDPHMGKNGEDLADYIRDEMSKCTQLLAVISTSTKSSQWVPWEIGVASEKLYPLATFSTAALQPEFLRKWPILKSDRDLDMYAKASKEAEQTFVVEKAAYNESRARRSRASKFYRTLRANI